MNDLIRPLVACSRQKEEEEEEEAGTCCFFRQNGCEGVSKPSLSVSLALSLSLSLFSRPATTSLVGGGETRKEK
jgi:hypothetical protein